MLTNHHGHAARAAMIASNRGLAHRLFTSPEMENLILRARMLNFRNILDADDRLIVERTWKDFEKAKKLPLEFVAETEKLYSDSYTVWVDAREKSDFRIFAPNLKRIVEVKRREAELLGYNGSPFNALLEDYEFGLTVQKLDYTFSILKQFLIPFLAKITKNRNNVSPLQKHPKISISRQREFGRQVILELGYDFKSGHLGESVHPFSESFHPTDARITIRYKEDDFREALYSGIHEAGHAMYEQNLPQEYYGTHLGASVSSSVHESQSRFWENIIGKSYAFWQYFYPLTQKSFPGLCDMFTTPEAFYKFVNIVAPSLIRTDADEVTYNLHVIIRHEIGRDLIEGKLKVDDVPLVWSLKMKKYLGIEVPDDAHGALQDCHWADGSFDFSIYTLGNLYAAQIYEAMQLAIPDLAQKISNGHFNHTLCWLRDNIHRHGARYTPEELITHTTDKPLDPYCLNKYLLQKYSDIYNL